MADLRTELLGFVMNSPVIGASGTVGYGVEYEDLADFAKIGGISGKGLTLHGQYGNKGERLWETPSGLINSIGLQNPGVEKFIAEDLAWLKQKTCVIANVVGRTLEDYEWQQLNFKLEDLDKLEKDGKFKIYEGVNKIENIAELVDEEKPYCIIIDQLTQLDSKYNKFDGVKDRFTYMTHYLKRLAMEKDIAVILVCQLRRGAEEREPIMSDINESGSIEEDSDNLIFLHRQIIEGQEHPQDFSESRPMVIKIEKQRDGEIGSIQAQLMPKFFRIYETDENA